MSENYKWVNWRSARYDSLLKPKAEPTIDQEVSKIVGTKVFTNDPRLVRLVIEEKKKKDPDNWDNFLHRPEFRRRLIEIFNPAKLKEIELNPNI
mgnify:CR=1 FL=1